MRQVRRLWASASAGFIVLAPERGMAADGFCAEGLGCLTGHAIGDVVLLLALIGASGLVGWAAILRLLTVRQTSTPSVSLIGERPWPVALTRLDGVVIDENEAMRAFGDDRSITARLAVFAGEGDFYRQSRQAVAAGVSIATIGQSERRLLTIQLVGRDRLMWQLMPDGVLDVAPQNSASELEIAPFGWVRLSASGPPVTNRTFDETFGAEALARLREDYEAGVLTPGCLDLPVLAGGERMAIAAHREPVGAQDDGTLEIFLFFPDQDVIERILSSDTLDAVPVAILRLDIEGRVFWGNSEARSMLGEGFAIGQKLEDIVQPLGRPMETILANVLNEGATGTGDMMRLKGEDSKFVQVALTYMRVHGQPSIMGVLTDASELRLLEDKFAQSQKMEAVGKLAGGVAHDFNNVLTAISGHCDLLLLRKDADHPDFSDLIQIRQNSHRAASLVRQLLAFSRKQTLQPRYLSVQDVVTDTLYLLDRLIGETIVLHLDHGRDIGHVRADQQQLEQALMNLVVNARDAMPKGGAITIATRNTVLEKAETRSETEIPSGDYVEISVTDSGAGIDDAVIDKVFDPFFTTKPHGEGTGLGLSTVHGIVSQSGGYIHAENVKTGGARFTILLPRVEPRPQEMVIETEAETAAPRPDLTGQGVVMLVEDEAPVRAFATRALKLRGYGVVEADSAEAAMQMLEDDPDKVDVLVSDVVMPGMDGPTFAARARELRPDLRVIFISGYAEASFERNLHDDDFLFLAKPFSLSDLTATVKQALSDQCRTQRPAPRREAELVAGL